MNERIVCHYKHAIIDHIRKAICGFSCKRSFGNKDVNKTVHIFNETTSNVSKNYNSHEFITSHEQNLP